jgi:hypothetical protein
MAPKPNHIRKEKMGKTTFRVCLTAIVLFWGAVIVAATARHDATTAAPAAAQPAPQSQKREPDREWKQKIIDECSKKIDQMIERNGRSWGETNGYDTMHYADRYCSLPAQHLLRDGSDWRCYDQIKAAFSGTRAYRDLDMTSGLEWARYERQYCSNLRLR